MSRYDVMFRKIRKLVVHYARDPEYKQKFKDKVERVFFSCGETKDDYDPEISAWRRYMPRIRRKDIEIFEADEYELIVQVTGSDDQTLNDLYTVITDQVVEDLRNDPCMERFHIDEISNGDGDEGCIYVTFKNPSNREFYLNY